MPSPTLFEKLDAEKARKLSDEERHKRIIMMLEQLTLLETTRSATFHLAASPKRGLLGSAKFSDEAILEQICSDVYQLPLSLHNVPGLLKLGPCYVNIAKAGLGYLRGPDATANGLAKTLTTALTAQTELGGLLQHLCANEETFFNAMRVIAESYLDRGSPAATEEKPAKPVRYHSDIVLKGEAGIYRPGKFIAEGSAGRVYAACAVNKASKWRAASSKLKKGDSGLIQLVKSVKTDELVLKAVKPTQKDSAVNEYRIAQKVATDGGSKYCVAYLDKIEDDDGNLWLVLARVHASDYGIDLTDYITGGFFQDPSHVAHAQAVVVQLLEGLAHIAAKGVCMRDVKPDNVLVAFQKAAGDEPDTYTARWTDFGLGVDLSEKGVHLRRPTNDAVAEDLESQLVGWWYDTQKLVPKPKWRARSPPEQCYQAIDGSAMPAYDMYMTGIIFCCMAFGIDFPHLNSKRTKLKTEEALEITLPDDYLHSFELGEVMRQHRLRFFEKFEASFGGSFGAALATYTERMLARSPAARPRPEEVLQGLKEAQAGRSPVIHTPPAPPVASPTKQPVRDSQPVGKAEGGKGKEEEKGERPANCMLQ